MSKLLAAVILAVLLIAGTFNKGMAALQNPGFETADLSGWNDPPNPPGGSGIVGATNSYSGSLYGPVEGSNFALLVAGSATVPTIVWQKVHLNAGEKLAGAATFLAWDVYQSNLPFYEYNDWAAVRVYGGNHDDGNFGEDWIGQPWYRDVRLVGNFKSTLWQFWSWSPTAEGDYYLWYGVTNIGDGDIDYSSRAGFDAVPLPPSLFLFSTGFLAFFFVRKKR